MEASVRTSSLTKIFSSGQEEIQVLHGINLTLYKGELAMLVGPSGCGKTTLLSILTGILSPTQGQVWVGETEITSLPQMQQALFRRHHVGFVFQQFNLIPALTAAENVAAPLLAGHIPVAHAIKTAHTFLTKMGLKDHAEHYPNQLSGGQQQRVAFARALVNHPKIIVCDEPTSALDEHTGQKVMEVLKSMAVQPDVGVIVVTHDPRIFHFADRIIHMNDGRIQKEERVVAPS